CLDATAGSLERHPASAVGPSAARREIFDSLLRKVGRNSAGPAAARGGASARDSLSGLARPATDVVSPSLRAGVAGLLRALRLSPRRLVERQVAGGGFPRGD